jgi:hypothetical protein
LAPPDAFAQTLPAPALPAPALPAPAIVQPRVKTLPVGSDVGSKRPSPPSSPPPIPRASQPAIRPSASTLSHAVPPMPTPDNMRPPAILPAKRSTIDANDRRERETENATAVEIDHEAKAAAQHARITGQRTKAPSIKPPPVKPLVPAPAKAKPKRIETEEARTDQLEVVVGDITETGVEVAPENDDLMATQQRESSAKADTTPIPTLAARDSNRLPSETPAPQRARTISTAPPSLPPPNQTTLDTAPSGPQPACPQCESPMAWVEEHLRFYCKSCRMYF